MRIFRKECKKILDVRILLILTVFTIFLLSAFYADYRVSLWWAVHRFSIRYPFLCGAFDSVSGERASTLCAAAVCIDCCGAENFFDAVWSVPFHFYRKRPCSFLEMSLLGQCSQSTVV